MRLRGGSVVVVGCVVVGASDVVTEAEVTGDGASLMVVGDGVGWVLLSPELHAAMIKANKTTRTARIRPRSGAPTLWLLDRRNFTEPRGYRAISASFSRALDARRTDA